MSAADEFAAVSALANKSLAQVVDMEWSVPAGTLDWTRSQTVDHMVDCVFSYAMQLASRSRGGFLPFHELHALPDATPSDLIQGLRAVEEIFVAVLQYAPSDAVASDGLADLGVDDWAQRGAYEVLLHTHDVLTGLAVAFDPPTSLCVVGTRVTKSLDARPGASRNGQRLVERLAARLGAHRRHHVARVTSKVRR